MIKTPVNAPSVPQPIGPYSPGIVIRVPERTLYCSGQGPLDPATGQLVEGDVAAQTERVLDNLEAVLSAAGMTFENVVKTTVFLIDMADFEAMNEVYRERFRSAPPARSTVAVAAIPRGARVEIEAVAAA